MEAISWCKNLLQQKEAQSHLEEKVQLLLDMYFKDKSDYAKEKFIKCFAEGIVYLENNLQYSRGLHHSQLADNQVYLMQNPKETMKKMEEVKQTLINEINRQHRHMATVLSEF